MAEPIYQITTEVSEEDFCRALKVSYPKKGMIGIFLIALGECLLGINFKIEYSYSLKMSEFFLGICLLILGISFFIWAALWQPKRYIRENIQRRRVVTGKDCVAEKMDFLEEEIVIHNLDVKKDYHIPYVYIDRIFLFEDMLVYTVDQGVGQIMKRDIPDELEFIQWFISRCSEARVKNNK